MKTAVIGSRSLTVEDIGQYLPNGTDEIITGGAKGVDRCVGEYAEKHSIPLTVIPPDYRRYKKGAPLRSPHIGRETPLIVRSEYRRRTKVRQVFRTDKGKI